MVVMRLRARASVRTHPHVRVYRALSSDSMLDQHENLELNAKVSRSANNRASNVQLNGIRIIGFLAK